MFGRSRLVTAAAVVALVCVGGGIAVASTTHAPWAESDRDAARSRYNSAETTLGAANVAHVHYLRSFSTPPAGPFGGCASGAERAVLTAGRLYFVGGRGVYSYDAATGKQIWHHAIADGDFTHFRDIAVSGGRVFVGEVDCVSASDPNGDIQVFDAATGAQLWGAPFIGFGTALEGLVVSGKYVVAAGVSIGSGARVAVFKAASGSVVWSRELTNTCFDEPALVVRQLVTYQTCDDDGNIALQAADLATGAVRWTKPGNWTALRGSSASATAGHLYAKNWDGSVVDLDPATGATRYPLSGATDVLAVGPARVFAACPDGICAYRTTTGARLWGAAGSGPVAVANGVVYTGDGQALSSSNGASIATVFSGPADQLLVGDGRIAVVSDPRIVDLYGLAGS